MTDRRLPWKQGRAKLFSLIEWCIFGLIVGGIARLLMPGRDPLGCFGTIALGIAGSFAGGILGTLLFKGPGAEIKTGRWIMSIVGAMLVLWGYRKYKQQSQ